MSSPAPPALSACSAPQSADAGCLEPSALDPTGRPSVQVLVTTVVVLLVSAALYRRYLSPLSDVPGPFWASFSRCWHIYITLQGNQNERLTQAHTKYGHFVRLANNEVSVSHPDAVRTVLMAPLEKGTMYKMSTFPDWRYQNPMSITDPKRKVELSKQFASGYTLTNALQAEEAIDGLVGQLLDRMDAFARAGDAVALDRHLTFLTFDMLGETLFSMPFGYLAAGADIGGSIATNAKLIGVHAVVAHFRWLQLAALNPWTTRLLPWGHLFNTAFAALRARRARPDARFDVVAHWLRTAARHPDRLSDRDILANAVANVGAGSDTVSCALQAFVYHMARRPALWARARAEVRAAAAAAAAPGPAGARVVPHAVAAKLPFLQACVKEALRIHNPVPMGLPRVAPAGGLTIGDRTLPQGTTVSVSPWVIHHSREIWGPDVFAFHPDRWLGPDAASLNRYWCPFGVGYMSCPGQHFAKMELSKIAATIVRDYDIRLKEPDRPWKWKAYFTMVPYDWPVYITKVQA